MFIRRIRSGRATGTTLTLTLIAAALLAPAAAAASPQGDDQASRASVTFTASGGVDVRGPQLRPGVVIVQVDNQDTTTRDLTVFSLNGSTTLDKVRQDISADGGGGPTGAAATTALTTEAHFVGGVSVDPGQHATFSTVALRPGRYYGVDTSTIQGPGQLPKVLGSVVVAGQPRRSADPDARAVIAETSGDRFVASSKTLPARGTVEFRNTSDTIHFVSFSPVAKGTTDAEVQAYFDSDTQDPPPFAGQGPSLTAEVLSPGVSEKLGYQLPAGDYVLLCFIADDMTGMPHAVMGMHLVVHLR